MGKKGKWISAVQRVLRSSHPEKEAWAEDIDQSESKTEWRLNELTPSNLLTSTVSSSAPAASPPPPPPPPPPSPPQPTQQPAEEIKEAILVEMESKQSKHTCLVALASAVAAESAKVAAQAAAEVVCLTATPRTPMHSKEGMRWTEEMAAIKIQAAFKRNLARRKLQALRGLVRLKWLAGGNAVKCQTAHTLFCMQTMTRVQTQIYFRRVKTEEEKKALQRQLQPKQGREIEKTKIGEGWDHSHQSKEQIEAIQVMKREAALRQERALAYAFSHQWRNSSARTVAAPMYTDPSNPNWGWSWTERWMAARSWDGRATPTKEPRDRAPVRNACISAVRTAVPRHAIAISVPAPATPSKSIRPVSRQLPSTPPSRPPSAAGKIRAASPRGSPLYKESDLRSIASFRSERPRRQSFGGTPVRDAPSLTRQLSIPRYMQATESVKAKARWHSQSADKLEAANRAPPGSSSVRKRLSFPVAGNLGGASPGKQMSERMRRHSDPPKLDLASLLKDVPVGP